MLARMQQRRECNWAAAGEVVAASAVPLQEALPGGASS
jgi:hypothetical protein